MYPSNRFNCSLSESGRGRCVPNPGAAIPCGAAHAVVGPSVAVVKYMGLTHEACPSNDSVAVTMTGALACGAAVTPAARRADVLTLNGRQLNVGGLNRMISELRLLTGFGGLGVTAWSTFPPSSGLGASAALCAAVTKAALRASGRPSYDGADVIAGIGSGSATRNLREGFVLWPRDSNAALQWRGPTEWPTLCGWAVVLEAGSKRLPSRAAHVRARSSRQWPTRTAKANLELAPRALDAIAQRDLWALGAVLEEDTRDIHEVLESASPPVRYMTSKTRTFVNALTAWRDASGTPAFASVGYGPNVIVLTDEQAAAGLATWLARRSDVLQTYRLSVCNRKSCTSTPA